MQMRFLALVLAVVVAVLEHLVLYLVTDLGLARSKTNLELLQNSSATRAISALGQAAAYPRLATLLAVLDRAVMVLIALIKCFNLQFVNFV